MNHASRHPSVLLIPAGLVALAAFVQLTSARTTCSRGPSRSELARTIAKKYAFEAFPRWAAKHPARRCPASLAELDGYLGREHSLDPWGGRYRMTCDRHGLLVRSAGEDQKWFTPDDLTSRQ